MKEGGKDARGESTRDGGKSIPLIGTHSPVSSFSPPFSLYRQTDSRGDLCVPLSGPNAARSLPDNPTLSH